MIVIPMFALEQMARTRIVCSNAFVEKIVEALYEFGAIQVTRSQVFKPSQPLPSFKEISEALINLRALEKRLEQILVPVPSKTRGRGESEGSVFDEASLQELFHAYHSIDFHAFDALEEKLRKAKEEEAAARARLNELAPFRNLEVSPAVFGEAKSLGFVYVALKPFKRTRENLEEDLRKLKVHASVLFVFDEGKEFALIAFEKNAGEKIGGVLQKHSSATHAIPVVGEKSFRQAFDKAREKAGACAAEKERVLNALAEFKEKFGARASALRNALEFRARKAELPFLFSESANLVAVEGWVPKKLLRELERKVDEATKGACVVEEVATSETPPSVLKNPRVIKPFEFLVRFFSLPSQREFDPTVLIAFSFPIFFGMILGDIGYGALALLIALVLRAKFRTGFFRDASGIMFLSALSTIFFGFVYAEFFGAEQIFGYELHAFIHRTEAHGLSLLMALCILVGFLHLALGFFVGFLTNVLHKHWKHAAAKASWLVLEISLFCLLASLGDVSFFELLKPIALLAPVRVWEVLLGASFIGLLAFEGVVGVMELPTLAANLFSYLRIMALGVSGVVFAMIVNKIPLNASFDAVAIASFVLFAAIFVAGHFVALLLGLFEASIQPLRLHYVEFFSKFYQGGGSAFKPLKEY